MSTQFCSWNCMTNGEIFKFEQNTNRIVLPWSRYTNGFIIQWRAQSGFWWQRTAGWVWEKGIVLNTIRTNSVFIFRWGLRWCKLMCHQRVVVVWNMHYVTKSNSEPSNCSCSCVAYSYNTVCGPIFKAKHLSTRSS